MQLASYVGTRSGIMGLGNAFIRFRIAGWKQALQWDNVPGQRELRASHTEVVFEPGDGVDHLMPDGTCEPNEAGELWCVSSTGLEKIPENSPRRGGHRGGVRFKRIKVHTSKWHLTPLHGDPVYAADWAVANQGKLYDWQLVFGFLVWVLPNKASRFMCNEAALEMMRFVDAHRFDPCSTQAIAETLHQFHLAATAK